MFVKILNYVLMFFLYSMLGWTVESTYRSLGETYRARKTTKEKKIINSGFLFGPMCPIYGTGALVFDVLLTPFKNYWWAVLLLGMLFADIVEYLTSVLMEKLFHARWWDYSHEFLNLNGRICLKHTIYWAVFSLIYVYFVAPVYDYLLSFVPQNIRYIMLAVIFAVFIVDLAFTVRDVMDIQKLMNKLSELKTSVSMAGGYVKAAADSLKGEALSKYDEFFENIASTPERFEEWRTEISAQIKSARTQFNEISSREKNKDQSHTSKRLFRAYPGMSTRVNKLIKDMEELWEEIKTKFQ
ncbi:MAG: putative ABC transporter permease [Oscillospiraceae bacterium]|nr:putative ABC transporter permease [Oscillospiraceae bacterium]